MAKFPGQTDSAPPEPAEPAEPAPADAARALGVQAPLPGDNFTPRIDSRATERNVQREEPDPGDIGTDGEVTPVDPLPRPSVTDRFLANYDDGYLVQSLSGGTDVLQARTIAEGAPPADDASPFEKRIYEHNVKKWKEYQAELSYSQMIPGAEGVVEYGAAIAGQIAGSFRAPENILLGIPSKLLAPVITRLGLKAGTAGAVIAEGALQGGLTNVALDPLTQAASIQNGLQDHYDAWRTAMALPVGAATGGILTGSLLGAGRIWSDTVGRVTGRAREIAAARSLDGDLTGAEGAVTAGTRDALDADAIQPEVRQAAEAKTAGPALDVPTVKPGDELASGETYRIKVSDLKTNAKAFQYKSEGDAEGVTQALKGVDYFDESKAGRIIAFQPKDGSLEVADGHQRTALARRLMAEGKAAPDTEITALIYREADGYTREDVRSIAAAANIATGTGTAIDAAKVLRSRPDLLNGALPPNSQLVRDARGLAKLSEDAFGYVTNEIVPERYGAMVGDSFKDPAMQSVAMRAIQKAEPANADEAAILMERIKLAAVEKGEKSAQGSLFGDMFDGPESTVIEEMKIVARALRRLRSDATLFKGAVAKADRLESAGNVVAREQSTAAADDAARAAFMAEKAFDTAGPIRESLTELARAVKKGDATVADASARFAFEVKKQSGGSPDLFGGDKVAAVAAERLPAFSSNKTGKADADAAETLSRADFGEGGSPTTPLADAIKQAEAAGYKTEVQTFNPNREPGKGSTRTVLWLTREGGTSVRVNVSGGAVRTKAFRAKIGGDVAPLAVRTATARKELAPDQWEPGLVETADPQAQVQATTELKQRAGNPTIDEFYQRAERNQAELAAAAGDIASELGLEVKNPGIKASRARVLEKMDVKNYPATGYVTDIVRLGFVARGPDDGDAIAAALAKRFIVLDERWQVNPAGFMDRKILVEFKDGQIGEVQVWPRRLYDAKAQTGQQIYERIRSAEAAGETEALPDLFAQSREVYARAIEAEGGPWIEFYRSAAASVEGNGGASGKAAANSSGARVAADAATSLNETGTQSPPGSTTAKATPASTSSNAGRPSQLQSSAGNETSQVAPLTTGLRGQTSRPAQGVPAQPGAPAIDIEGLRAINERLVNALDLTTRQGRLSARAAPGTQVVRGQHDFRQGVSRLREIDDYEAHSHEAGHAVEAKMSGDIRPILNGNNAARREVAALDYTQSGNVREGFAEFFRLYMTNRTFVQQHAPTFYAAFDAMLSGKDPKLHADLAAAYQAFAAYKAAPSGQAVAAGVVSSYDPKGVRSVFRSLRENQKDKGRYAGLVDTIAVAMSKFYTTTIDEKHPVYLAVRALARIHFENTGQRLNLKTIDDPYKLSRLSADAYNAGHTDLAYGVHGYHDASPSGPSLREAIVEATGQASAFGRWSGAKLKQFSSYLVSKRAVFEYGRYQRGEIPNAPTAETLGDHEVNIRELEAANPQFVTAAAKVYEWTKNLLQKEFDAGLISKDQFEQALRIENYVPFLRDMTDRTPAGGSPSRSLERAGGLDRFRGSSRPIIDPIESLMKRAYDVNILIKQNDVIKALDRLAASAGYGAGRIAERIPNHQMRVQSIDPIEALENAARTQGIDPVDARQMIQSVSDLLGDDARASIFRLGEISTGGEPIVFLWEGGQRKALRLADGEFGREMFDVLTGMPDAMRDLWTLTVAKPAALLRAGITTSPDFLLANYLRDQMSAWILTEGYTPFVSGAIGIAREVTQGDMARLHSMAGGISGGANVASLRDARIKHDLDALKKKGWISERIGSLEGLAKIAETSETGTRLGVFAAAFKRSKSEGLDDYEAAMEAAYYARDLIDFGRHGSRMAASIRLVPFLNASLQGLDKANRVLFAPAAKHLTGRVLTAEDQKALGASMKAWGKLTALALMSMGLRALYRDDPDFDEASEYIRATHWVFKNPVTDKFIRIPKPFELAAPLNLAERMYEYFALNDPKAVDKFARGVLDITAPPNALFTPLVKVPIEVTTNRNLRNVGLIDLLTGQGETRPIVPDHMLGLEKWLQYTQATSTMSKQIGNVTGLSPAVLDHVFFGFTGSWGRSLAALYDAAAGEKGEQGAEDAFLVRRFTGSVTRGSQSVNDFWKQMGTRTGALEAKSLSYKSLIDQGRESEANEYLSRLTGAEAAYVVLNRAGFDADTKRINPLRRARDAVTVINGLRREIAGNNVHAITDQTDKIEVTAREQHQLQDALSHVAMLEARNSLIATKERGYEQRQVIDPAPSYDVIRAINPKIADELANRYAAGSVFKFDPVAANWAEAQRRLIRDGADADLSDLKSDVAASGYTLDAAKVRRSRRRYAPPGRGG